MTNATRSAVRLLLVYRASGVTQFSGPLVKNKLGAPFHYVRKYLENTKPTIFFVLVSTSKSGCEAAKRFATITLPMVHIAVYSWF